MDPKTADLDPRGGVGGPWGLPSPSILDLSIPRFRMGSASARSGKAPKPLMHKAFPAGHNSEFQFSYLLSH